MAEIDIEKMAKNVAESALDSILYQGKSIREWMQIICEADYVGKWIPVSERLPEENETVLINYCRLNEHSVRMAIWDELHCRFYNSEYTKYVSVDFVTAWMPLPKPYESQERSGKE